MRYSVIENTTLRTSKGEYRLSPGQMIELSEDAADKLLKMGKIKPAPQATAETDQESLEEVMGDIVQDTCNRIIEEYEKRGIRSYKLTPENMQTEKEIDLIYRAVLDGKAEIETYKQACQNWFNAAISAGGIAA